jgi:hypothetical protein
MAAAPDVLRQITRQIIEAFFMYPHVIAGVISVGLAALIVGGFWVARGSVEGLRGARLALKAQALRNQKDHRAMILLARIEGPGGERLREALREAIDQRFGDFAFRAPVQVEPLPVKLKVLKDNASARVRRRTGALAVEALEKSAGDVLIWGRRQSLGGRVELRIATPPAPGLMEEVHVVDFKWSPGQNLGLLGDAVAYACARRSRPVLNKPQDYKPEKLQPIVEALDQLVREPPASLSEKARLEVLSDYASGALSLGERGGDKSWLERALEARRIFLSRVERSEEPLAWGRAQQEVGRALAALGEREADRSKLEEAVTILRTSLDALRATESLQSAEVAMRALSRAEQTLAARRRIGLRWPV